MRLGAHMVERLCDLSYDHFSEERWRKVSRHHVFEWCVALLLPELLKEVQEQLAEELREKLNRLREEA